jgi:hypothetical protein
MVGLLLKDILNLKKYVKQIAFAMVLFVVFGINMKNPPYIIGMMVMMSSMMVITSMGYDEQAKWDKYALTMPILKKDIVLSKYLLLVVTTLIGAGVSLFVSIIMITFLDMGNIKETLLACGIIILIAILSFSLLIPVIFKVGVEKARIMMFIVFGIPSLIILGAFRLIQKYNIPKPSEAQLKMLGYAFPFIVIIIYGISYLISVSIFNKKEL